MKYFEMEGNRSLLRGAAEMFLHRSRKEWIKDRKTFMKYLQSKVLARAHTHIYTPIKTHTLIYIYIYVYIYIYSVRGVTTINFGKLTRWA